MEQQFFTNNKDAIVSSNRILYTASSFARSSLLHLQEIGELCALRPHISSRSNLSSYLFFTVLSGSGELEYKGKKFSLTTGDCVFIDCNNLYSHTTSNNLWSLKWIHFNGPQMRMIYDKYCERGGRPVFSTSSTDVDGIWKRLMEVAGSADYMRDMLINQHLSTLLTLIMSESWHPEDRKATPKRQSVADVRTYIEENYREKITLDDLASRFFIDKYYLGKSFKEQFGATISNYLENIRITKAKQALRFSEKTVEQIGAEVGFPSPDYFSRVFKKVEGVSPKQYREQW